MKEKEEVTKSVNELIIDEAVKQFNEGKIWGWIYLAKKRY